MKNKIRQFYNNVFSGVSISLVIRVTVMCIVLSAIVVSFYYQISHRFSAAQETGNPKSELETCLTKDFVANYPNNPRDVVRWYNRIITLYYSEKLKDDQLEKLCDQARLLMDKELLSQNPRDVYISSVKQDIEMYSIRESSIIEHDEGSNSDVKYAVANNGDDLAYVVTHYVTKEAGILSSTYQEYCLRKDGAGRYRILAYELAGNKEEKK